MSLNKKSTVGLMFGQPGSGKSASAVRYLVREHLPNGSGMFITNLPLRVEAIVKYGVEVYGMKPEEVRDKIHIMPQSVIEEWKESRSRPDTYFERLWEKIAEEKGIDPDDTEMIKQFHPLSRGRIVLDEARKFLPAKPLPQQREFIAAMLDWLATVRHEGCRVIFIAQGRAQLHREIFDLAGFQIHLTNMGDLPAPKLGIRLDTFCQTWAKLGGAYWQNILEQEFIAFGEGLKETRSSRWWLGPSIFQFYASQNRDDGTEGQEELPEYQRFGWPKFVAWVFKENWWGITWSTLVVIFFLVFFWPGNMLGKGWVYAINNAHLIFQNGVFEEGQGGSENSIPDDPQVAELIDTNRTMREALKLALIEISDYETENKRLSEELQSSSQMVLIDPAGIILVNGDRINEGSPVTAGPYRGRIVEGVDVRARVATLDDGTLLRLRESVANAQPFEDQSDTRQRPEPTPARATDVPRPLPGNQSDTGWYSTASDPRQPGPAPPVIQQ